MNEWIDTEVEAIKRYAENVEQGGVTMAMRGFVASLPPELNLGDKLEPAAASWLLGVLTGREIYKATVGGGSSEDIDGESSEDIQQVIETLSLFKSEDLVLMLLDHVRACIAVLWRLPADSFRAYAFEAIKLHDTQMGKDRELAGLIRGAREVRGADFITRMGEEDEDDTL